MHGQKFILTNLKNLKINEVYTMHELGSLTPQYNEEHLRNPLAVSSDIAACLPTSDWGRAVNYGRFCLPTESRMAITVNQP